MLHLTRKVGERIMIDDKTEITICKVRGDKVSVGIQAPKEVRVVRSELLLKNPPKPTVDLAKKGAA